MLSLGAKVAGGDINPAPITEGQFAFVKTDVTSWESQLALFERAMAEFGRVDHVFANAGECDIMGVGGGGVFVVLDADV